MFKEAKMACLIEYELHELDKVKGWDVLVAPDGKVLKVCERGNMDPVHDEFTELYADMKLGISLKKLYQAYQDQNPMYKNKKLGSKDIFINLLGYTNFEQTGTNHVEITPPDPAICGRKFTDQQFISIQRLLEINGDSLQDLFQVFKYDQKVHEHELHCEKRYMR